MKKKGEKVNQRKYRIVRSLECPGHFEIQYRRKWWPFWQYADTATTIERARETAQAHSVHGRLIEDMGWLPAVPEANE